ncbi:MAG: acyltransferase [Gammaproteobacteria bacterium]|nr:acyltransferase [Gammaproteobacteria bacterium]
MIVKLFRRVYDASERLVLADLPEFANQPARLNIELPRRIANPHCITIGDDVHIGPGALLIAQLRYPSSVMQHPNQPVPLQFFQPKIVIGDRVTSTGLLTITAMCSVTIEDDVMFASNVLVSDGMHGFKTANQPYKYQPMWKIEPIVIGRGSWIGQNVVVMPGVTLGEQVIVGANSVVTKDVPARTIVAGTPARIIKRWDELRQDWIEVSNETPTIFK